MAWIYCHEALPGPNCPRDYVKVLGHLLSPIPEKEWVKVPTKLDRPWWYDSRERGKKPTNQAILNAKHDIHTADEFGQAAAAKFGDRGLVFMENNPETNEIEARKLEKLSEKANREFRERQIAHFEAERRRHVAGEGGRLEPTRYELECFRELGLPMPGSIDEIKAARGPAKMELSPELAQLLDENSRIKTLERELGETRELLKQLLAAQSPSKPQQHQPKA